MIPKQGYYQEETDIKALINLMDIQARLADDACRALMPFWQIHKQYLQRTKN